MPVLALSTSGAGVGAYTLLLVWPLPFDWSPEARKFINAGTVLFLVTIVSGVVITLLYKHLTKPELSVERHYEPRMAWLRNHRWLLAIKFHPRLGGKLPSEHEAAIAAYRHELKQLPTFVEDPVYRQ